MKSVSDAYKISMRGPLRERSFCRISLNNIDADAATDGQWVGNGEEVYSEVDTLDYPYRYRNTVATLELNRWALDGNTGAAYDAESVNDGFVSSYLSGNDGSFSAAPVVTRAFSEPHTFQGLTVTFDSRAEEWPVSITVKFYLNGEIVDTVSASPEASTAQIATTATEVDKIELTFNRTLPYRRPRLQYVMFGFGEEFGDSDIFEVRQTDDVDPLSRRLPSEKLTFTLVDYAHRFDPDNPASEYIYVDANAPVSVQYGYQLPGGSIEWLKADKYLLDGKPTVSNNRATFNATGLIGRLTDIFYKSKVGEKNLYDMAEEILVDANLTPTESGDNPWDIDESLKTMYTTAVLPIATHMNCLQLVAHAARCRMFTDDENIIHLKPFGVTVKGIYRGEYTDNGHTAYSEWESVDGGNTYTSTYATLELNRWALDGNQISVPESPSGRGYVGAALADRNGEYESYPTFSKSFEVSHDLPLLSIRFDDITATYPKAIQVKYYKDNTLLDTKNVEDISTYEVTVTSALAIDCTRFDVIILSALPYMRARVTKIYYRETDFTLDFNAMRQDGASISKIDQLKAVTVAKYSYAPEDSEGGGLYNVDGDDF